MDKTRQFWDKQAKKYDHSERQFEPTVYRTSTGWRIFFFIFMPPLICLMAWVMVYSIVGSDIESTGTRIFLFLIGAGFDIFLIFAFISTVRYKAEVFKDRIVLTELFRKKEMLLSDILGFRILQTQYIGYVQIIPASPAIKKIKIALTMNNSKGFLEWITATSKNLDAEEYGKEVQSILSNEELGFNEEQRAYALERARKWTKFLNIASFAAILWAWFWPRPYEIMVWALVVFPFLAICSTRLFPGIIKLDGPKKGAYPTIAIPFMLPPVALSLRALLDWNILLWHNFWVPFLLASAVLFFTTVVLFDEVRKKYSQAVLILMFCAVYGYSATISLNGILDESRQTQYRAAVLDKHISSGKTTSYYIKLSPWGPRRESKDADVSKSLYEAVSVSDSVDIFVKPGAFLIPWFFVRRPDVP